MHDFLVLIFLLPFVVNLFTNSSTIFTLPLLISPWPFTGFDTLCANCAIIEDLVLLVHSTLTVCCSGSLAPFYSVSQNVKINWLSFIDRPKYCACVA